MRRIYPSARDKILDATERVILRDGPSGVTVDAVLAESGMSKGGFFHHFATKTALLGGLLERLSRAIASMAPPSMRGDTAATRGACSTPLRPAPIRAIICKNSTFRAMVI